MATASDRRRGGRNVLLVLVRSLQGHSRPSLRTPTTTPRLSSSKEPEKLLTKFRPTRGFHPIYMRFYVLRERRKNCISVLQQYVFVLKLVRRTFMRVLMIMNVSAFPPASIFSKTRISFRAWIFYLFFSLHNTFIKKQNRPRKNCR